MISKGLKYKKYCCEDPSLIENYDKAIKDDTQTWDCHHKLETELKLSIKELIEKDLYFNRPASELIFLSHIEHAKLHGGNNKNGWHLSEETKQKLRKPKSQEVRKNMSISKLGKHKVYDENGKFHYE